VPSFAPTEKNHVSLFLSIKAEAVDIQNARTVANGRVRIMPDTSSSSKSLTSASTFVFAREGGGHVIADGGLPAASEVIVYRIRRMAKTAVGGGGGLCVL
jgi:hypothetical protein